MSRNVHFLNQVCDYLWRAKILPYVSSPYVRMYVQSVRKMLPDWEVKKIWQTLKFDSWRSRRFVLKTLLLLFICFIESETSLWSSLSVIQLVGRSIDDNFLTGLLSYNRSTCFSFNWASKEEYYVLLTLTFFIISA